MIRVNAVVEGKAEESFLQEILARHLTDCEVALVPRKVEFGRKRGRIYRGGLLDYIKLKKDVINWLNQDKGAWVTTMVDLYALPNNFPGREDGKNIADPCERVAFLEHAFADDIGCFRFLPHIQLHEFETILFADIARLVHYYPRHGEAIQMLVQEVAQIANPEMINERQEWAPSKRILRHVPGYDKVWAGSLLAMDLGLALIRAKCPHFDAWVKRLESLTQASDQK